jgi:hypothetical protein
LTFTGTTYTGTNAGDFAASANTCTGTLANGHSCVVTSTFTPSATAGTSETATLNVAYTGIAGSPATVSLRGISGSVVPFAPAITLFLGP